MHFAQSVKMIQELPHKEPDEPICQYYYREYLDLMESILMEQIVTAFPDEDEISAVLTSVGLDYLVDETQMLFREWKEENNS